MWQERLVLSRKSTQKEKLLISSSLRRGMKPISLLSGRQNPEFHCSLFPELTEFRSPLLHVLTSSLLWWLWSCRKFALLPWCEPLYFLCLKPSEPSGKEGSFAFKGRFADLSMVQFFLPLWSSPWPFCRPTVGLARGLGSLWKYRLHGNYKERAILGSQTQATCSNLYSDRWILLVIYFSNKK